jgi:chromosome segregation ATPase
MSQNKFDDLQETTQRLRELEEALTKLENQHANPTGAQVHTLMEVQRELAAALSKGRDAIQTTLIEADLNAAKRLDATVNALNNRLSATNAAVLIAAEKAKANLENSELSVKAASSSLVSLCDEIRAVAEGLQRVAEAVAANNSVIQNSMSNILRQQKLFKFLVAINLVLILAHGLFLYSGVTL